MTLGEEKICFYAEIGHAITQWANVEDALRITVNACLVVEDHNAVQLGFFSIENFRSKLEFADRVVSRRFGGNPRAEGWDKLVDRARTASVQRNKLAHRRVRLVTQGKVGRRYALETWIVLIKDIRACGDTKPYPGALCLRDIFGLTYQFASVTAALVNFAHRLNGQKEPYAKDAEQAPNPPTIHQIRLQILGGPLTLPVPSRK